MKPLPARDDERLLRVEGLAVAFATKWGPVRAVRGVDLEINAGEVVALVGESGSGKSTIGHALASLYMPEDRVTMTGRILLRDKRGRTRDLLTLSRAEQRAVRGEDVAMIFQEPLSSLDPVFSVGTQIVEAVRVHRRIGRGQAEARAVELLAALGLANPAAMMRVYPHQISGGMRQRVMIAMALACDPTLLIADEPTTALDVTIQAQIVDLLKAIQRRTGMAILFVTHDLGLVAEIADRAYVMYAGEIVETAPVSELFARPLMPYTRALLETRPSLGCSLVPGYRLNPIPGQAPRPTGVIAGCAFAPRCAHAGDPCREPQRLEALAGDRRVRCVRWSELGASVAEEPR
jgi:oligopeptide/dipeptide ABC transporter ATP-binding protein